MPPKPVLLEIPESSAALRPDSYSTHSPSMQNEPNRHLLQSTRYRPERARRAEGTPTRPGIARKTNPIPSPQPPHTTLRDNQRLHILPGPGNAKRRRSARGGNPISDPVILVPQSRISPPPERTDPSTSPRSLVCKTSKIRPRWKANFIMGKLAILRNDLTTCHTPSRLL